MFQRVIDQLIALKCLWSLAGRLCEAVGWTATPSDRERERERVRESTD